MNSRRTLQLRLLAEIAASAMVLHRAMSALAEPSATTELVDRLREFATVPRPKIDISRPVYKPIDPLALARVLALANDLAEREELLARVAELRRLIETDGNPDDPIGQLTLSLLDNIAPDVDEDDIEPDVDAGEDEPC